MKRLFVRHIAVGVLLTGASLAHATLPMGQSAPVVEFKGDAGGTVDGKAWSSANLASAGKVHLLVYSTVGEKDTNNEATEAIHNAEFPKDKFATVAVINMKSSWQPNFLIDKAIKEKQARYTTTTYVRDLNRALVEQWKLADKSNNILVFDKAGKVVFSVDGKLSKEQQESLMSTIRSSL
jgi:predicted transcriptional regulator